MSFSLSSREQKTISNVRRLFEHASKQHKQRKARKTIQNQLRQILLRRKRKPASILLLLLYTSLLSVQRDEGPAFSSPSLAVPASGLPDFKKNTHNTNLLLQPQKCSPGQRLFLAQQQIELEREISFLHSALPLRLRFRHRFQKLASRSSVSDSRPTDRVKGKKGGYRCELVFRGHVCTIFSLHSLSFT